MNGSDRFGSFVVKAVEGNENQNKIFAGSKLTGIKTMKKERKKQEDRLLKQLSLRDRQRQMRLRQQIMEEALFLVV